MIFYHQYLFAKAWLKAKLFGSLESNHVKHLVIFLNMDRKLEYKGFESIPMYLFHIEKYTDHKHPVFLSILRNVIL